MCLKVLLLGIAYMVLSVVVSKVVVVFLQYLTASLRAVPVAAVLILFLLVGIAMFLIPVIPGVPVYVCSGVLIPPAMMSDAERASTDAEAPSSFWAGLLLACILSVALKFCAIVIQQEVIGRRLGQRVAVRAACQVNSGFLRAARFVLMQRGLTFDKCMVLCGGPDWPTSVFTGIIRLSCPQMLLGSLPVILVIAPCSSLGAALTMINRPGWDAACKVLTLLSLGAQLGVTIGFAACIERASSVHASAIAKLPLDAEVAALDEYNAAFAAAWRDASDWRREGGVPWPARLALVSAAVSIVLACHLTVMLRCFARVTVADPFDAPPINGNPLNVVWGTQGVVVLCCFGYSLAVLFAYRRWLHRQATELMQRQRAWQHALPAAASEPASGSAAPSSRASGPGVA